MKRTQAVVELTEALGKLFVRAKLDPKATSQPNGKTDDPLAPDVLKVLEKSMNQGTQSDHHHHLSLGWEAPRRNYEGGLLLLGMVMVRCRFLNEEAKKEG